MTENDDFSKRHLCAGNAIIRFFYVLLRRTVQVAPILAGMLRVQRYFKEYLDQISNANLEKMKGTLNNIA